MRHIALAAILLASACSTGRPEPIPAAPVDPEHCGNWDGVYDYLDVEPGPARQGAILKIAARQWRGPANQATPPDCTSDWAVSDPALAALSGDRSTVRIAPDAAPGATVTISYTVKGKSVAAPLLIVATDAIVLTGRRGQRAVEDCEQLIPVGELEFTADGHFSVTYQPFETYRDYWGTYRLDPATGALSMVAEGGNDRPGGLDLEGKAGFAADGKLVLEGMYLGQPGSSGGPPPPARGCRYTFG
jgi:hypothetical protein